MIDRGAIRQRGSINIAGKTSLQQTEDEMERLPLLEQDSDSRFVKDSSQSRLDQAFTVDRATLLLGSYRKDNATNPEAYVQAITLVLSDYPQPVVEMVTDPRTGIQADERYLSFAPNAGEVRMFCEEKMRWLNRREQTRPLHTRKHEYARPQTGPGCRGQAWIHPQAPQFKVAERLIKNPELDPCDWRYEEREGVKGLLISYSLHLAIKGRTAA